MYVYRYHDADGALIYVGMTSNAARRAAWHWDHSDWRSWVMSAEYERCHSRDEAFRLETKIRKDEAPLFTRVTGYAAMIRELDARYLINHVTEQCYCNQLTEEILAGHSVVELPQHDPVELDVGVDAVRDLFQPRVRDADSGRRHDAAHVINGSGGNVGTARHGGAHGRWEAP